MKRAAQLLLGGAVGALFGLMLLGLIVERPASCGEPTACGQDYLFPALYGALAILATGLLGGGLVGRADPMSIRSVSRLLSLLLASFALSWFALRQFA